MPTLRCRYVATTRLIVENDYVAAPSFRPQRGFAALAKCFRLDTASPPAKMVDIIPMSLCGNNSSPALRERQKYFHPPRKVKGLYYNVAIRIARLLPYLYLSLRGATDFVATWQSRGSAIVARVLSSRLPRHLTCTTNSLFFQ